MAIKTYDDQNFVAIANAIRSKNGETTQYKPSEMAAAISALETALEILPQDTVSGALANFPDGSNNYPVVELIADINPKQAGSGDPAPDNVRPISGSTEVKVYKQGKNLCKNGLVNETVSGVNITINSDGAITLNGTATARFTRNLCANFTLKAGSYTLSCGTAALPISCYLNMNGGGQSISCTANVASKVVTYQEDTNINYIRIDIANGSILNNLTLYPMLEAGSTATAYEPYSAPEVKTISWESEAGTVYKGTLNVTTGVLTVDYKYLSISEVTQAYSSAGSGYFGGRLNVSDMKYNQRTNGYCDTLIAVNSPSAQTINCVCFGANNKDIFIVMSQDLVGSTLESLNSYLSSNPVNVLYPLDTPEVYQLEPEEVKTLLGVNNIYADTGNVSVTYRADIDLYIAKKIAEGA